MLHEILNLADDLATTSEAERCRDRAYDRIIEAVRSLQDALTEIREAQALVGRAELHASEWLPHAVPLHPDDELLLERLSRHFES